MNAPLTIPFTRRAAALAALSLFAPLALAGNVSVRADFSTPEGAPFPSNRYTVFDGANATLRRVALPKPDCAVRPSDCIDIDVLNTLDGFSTQPRITIPFTGDIDPTSVNSQTVYLLNLGDTLTLRGFGERVGINNVLWDTATQTLSVQSDELLQQHSRYLLVVTDGVKDSSGNRIKSGGWGEEFGQGQGGGFGAAAYRSELRSAVQGQRPGRDRIVAASLFTTQSITADLAKINRQIRSANPAPVNFNIGNNGAVRAVFPTATLQGIQYARQVNTAPVFANVTVPTFALGVAPGAVASVAYGQFASPDYQSAGKVIPATGTLAGQPQVLGSNNLLVQVFVPAGPKPAAGWPVAMFGHGFGDSMYGAPWTVAATLASYGIATVSINVVGHAGGAAGTLSVAQQGQSPVVLPGGGRGIDQDGNGSIDGTEGSSAAAPNTLLGSRDGLRQTAIDYMQLVRQIEAGIDIDGDGSIDLDKNRVTYAGQSFGGIYGTILLGVDGRIQAGVPNVPGGSITEIARLSPVFRVLTGLALLQRQPALLNLPPSPALPVPFNFNENMPLRDQPPVTNTVPGAMAIQSFVDRAQWATQSGNPVSYAPYIRRQPLPGNAPKPVIVQFAKGDATVPNPTSSAILRAGGLADRATYFRNDLAWAANNALSKNPHTFLTSISGAGAPYALMAQKQMATFLASGGLTVIDPDGAGLFFEVPIAGPLPEVLNLIP